MVSISLTVSQSYAGSLLIQLIGGYQYDRFLCGKRESSHSTMAKPPLLMAFAVDEVHEVGPEGISHGRVHLD